MKHYNPKEIEAKWRQVWREKKIFQPDLERAKKPFYNLMMFPYPSAEGLHVGNMYAFTGADIYGRFKRMEGLAVFQPIGLDGFGIHSENYAIKIGKHPAKLAKETEKTFYRQLEATGNAYAWDNTLETYDPDYYRWTQWIFIQMFKHGLAYRKKAAVNWCPSCKTVLADEQVIAGRCERCSSEAELKELEQWFFKITAYAEKLLENLEWIDWSERVKMGQKNWIGRSEGAEIKFPIPGSKYQILVFTTRPDTLFGATFMALAPEHPLVPRLSIDKYQNKIRRYVNQAAKKTEIQRIAEGRVKTGVFTGSYCLNPVNHRKIPVWVADYVVMSYGSGAIMGVPGHDERDWEFAQKYGLAIKPVIEPLSGSEEPQGKVVKKGKAYEGPGVLINSGPWNGWRVPAEMEKVIAWLEKRKIGRRSIRYKLRDWCISRQRYWGPPIPMIYCPGCAQKGLSGVLDSHLRKGKGEESRKLAGWFPVPEKELPVRLPHLEDFRPKGLGRSPLAQLKDWVEVSCPHCGGPARRETDVSDTFLDSAWYFFRYPSLKVKNSKLKIGGSQIKIPWNKKVTEKWLPVDMYIGGAEHAVLHLMYSRFITMVFKDLGLIDFEEPYQKFYAHGLITKDGAKMSKSKGNMVIPDEYIKRDGADTLRMYLMFLGPFNQGGDFTDEGIEGIKRFLNRVWGLVSSSAFSSQPLKPPDSLKLLLYRLIKKVGEDIAALKFNTAIAAMMEFVNSWGQEGGLSKKEAGIFVRLLAPFAPHLAEELWCQVLGNPFSVHQQPWPKFDPRLIKEEKTVIVIQVNGRVRGQIEVKSEKREREKEIVLLAKKEKNVARYLTGQRIKKVVFVPGKLINFVT